MSRRPLDNDLARVPLFAHLSKAQLRVVSGLATPLEVKAGRVLAREGEIGEELIIVVEGTVEVDCDGRVLATRGPGEFFGEVSLLLERPRMASVTAKTDMRIEVIERHDFKAFLKDNPQLYEPLLTAMAARLADIEFSMS